VDIYKGGEDAFNSLILDNVVYPKNSFSNKIEGILVYQIIINPNGDLQASFLTKLDSDIELEVAKVLELSGKEYVVQKEKYSVYHTLIFTLDSANFIKFKEEMPEFKNMVEFPWTEPLLIHANLNHRIVTRKSLGTYEVGPGRTLPAGSIPNRYQNTPVNSNGSYPSQYSNIDARDFTKLYNGSISRLSKHIRKEKANKALDELNLLIRLNPFNREHLQLRRKLEVELGLVDYKKYDEALIFILEQK
jgi:hypothetical protein